MCFLLPQEQLCEILSRCLFFLSLIFRMPVVTVVEGVDSNDYELELDADSLRTLPLISVPVFVTLTRIGNTAIVDASLEEEQCSSCRVAFAVNQKGNICTTQKGNGVISVSQLQQMMLVNLLEIPELTCQDASVIGQKVIELMDKVMLEEKRIPKKFGFLHSALYK